MSGFISEGIPIVKCQEYRTRQKECSNLDIEIQIRVGIFDVQDMQTLQRKDQHKYEHRRIK